MVLVARSPPRAQSFAVVIIKHVEGAEAWAITEPVVREIHRPGDIRLPRHIQWIGLVTQYAPVGLDSQVRFQPPVNGVDALVIEG